MDRARVILADDHPEFLKCTAALLRTEFDVIAAVGDGQSLIDAMETLNPDALVLDISMPVLTGFEAARLLRLTGSQAKIVFLTVPQDQDFIDAAQSLGADGYVIKNRLASDLLPALREVLTGRCYVSSN
jgi:DNA-binding NarL/FixJ family response regulator